MTLTDQADFVIADTGIHRGPVAWKLGTSFVNSGAAAHFFSAEVRKSFQDATESFADRKVAPISRYPRHKTIQLDRSVFGGSMPVHNGPEVTG